MQLLTANYSFVKTIKAAQISTSAAGQTSAFIFPVPKQYFLEHRMAVVLGKGSAVSVPSGTAAQETACHCPRGPDGDYLSE